MNQGQQVNTGAAVFRKMRAVGQKLGEDEEFDRILERMKEARTGHPSIVMVGEISRGKSTLVNALLGQPGLAPVDAAETTALVVNYTPTSPEHPAGSAVLEFEYEPRFRDVPLPELASWTRVGGEKLRESEEAPKQAVVHVDSWLLPKCVIVDTPGTGGLSEAYARRAFDRAERASVLVLVTDAGGRISSHALEFLKHCADKVAQVIVVVNKIDAHRNNWRSIVEEDRAILAQAGPGLGNIPILGMSARWAEQAAAEPDPAKRQKLLEYSLINDFIQVVNRALKQADEIPAQNALRQAQSALKPHLETRLVERAALIDAAEAAKNPDAAEDAELIRAKEKREELMLTFDDSKYDWPAAIEDLRGDLQMKISARTRHFQNVWKDKVEASWNGLTKEKALVMQNELDAALEVEMTEHIRETIFRCAGLVKWLYAEAGMAPTPELLHTFGVRKDAWRGQRHEQFERRGQKMDARMLLGSAMMGSGIARLALVGAGAAVAMPAALGVAVVMGGTTLWTGKRKQNKQAVLQVIQDRTTEMRELLERFTRQSITLIQTEAKKQFDRDLKKSVNKAKEEVVRIQKARSATLEERQVRLRQLEPQITELKRLLADADRELGTRSAVRG